MSLLQFNAKSIQFNAESTPTPGFYHLNFDEDWLPASILFRKKLFKPTSHIRTPNSRLHDYSNLTIDAGRIKKSNRMDINLVIYPYMWAELKKQRNLKILWSLMVHKNYLKYQKGSLLTTGKLIPEYTQLHIREEFARSSYSSPSTRRNFVKKIKPQAEEVGIKIYEREDFKSIFRKFSSEVQTLTELKQLKEYILNGLQEIE